MLLKLVHHPRHLRVHSKDLKHAGTPPMSHTLAGHLRKYTPRDSTPLTSHTLARQSDKYATHGTHVSTSPTQSSYPR